MRGRAWVMALVAGLVVGAEAEANSLVFGPHDVPSLFSISKSENKNQVIYAIHLDEHCAPAGDAPLFAFWRMLEVGPTVIQPLLPREQPAYGIDTQTVLDRSADGGRARVTLRALPRQPIVVETRRAADGRCQAWATTTIDRNPAYLYNVHAALKWPFGVDYLLLSGWSLDRTRVVHEKIEP